MLPPVLCFIIAMASLTLSAANTHADVVLMENGDRLSGVIVRLQDNILHLKTAYAKDELPLPWSEVTGIETDAVVAVELNSGDIVQGRLLQADEEGALLVSGKIITGTQIHMNNVQAINPPPQTALVDGSITLGGNWQSGNTDRNALNAAIDAVIKGRKHRFMLDLIANYAEEGGQVAERNTFGRLKYDFFLSRQVYAYLNNEFLYDRFKDLNLRTVVGPGAGYQVWDDKNKSLAFEAGLAYYNEDRNEEEDETWITARLAARFVYTFASGIGFSERVTMYPSLDNRGEFTLRNEATVTSPIGFGWAMQLRSIIEHDSDPELETIEQTDYSWILGLNYSF